jgi:hypothetical protein
MGVVRFLALTFLSERQGEQHVVEVENIIQLVDYGCGVDEKPSLNTRDALLTHFGCCRLYKGMS